MKKAKKIFKRSAKAPSLLERYNSQSSRKISQADLDVYLDYVESYIRAGGIFDYHDIRRFSSRDFSFFKLGSGHDDAPISMGRGWVNGRLLNPKALLKSPAPYINKDVFAEMQKRGVDTDWRKVIRQDSILDLCFNLNFFKNFYDKDDTDENAIANHFLSQRPVEDVRKLCNGRMPVLLNLPIIQKIELVRLLLGRQLEIHDARKARINGWRPARP